MGQKNFLKNNGKISVKNPVGEACQGKDVYGILEKQGKTVKQGEFS